MRHVGVALLVVAMVFGLTGVAQAVVTTGHAAAAVRVAGQLTKIDGKALTITTTIEGKATDTVITCNDATKFSRDGGEAGAQVKFEDLKVGQNVRAYYTAADNMAKNVIIAAAPAPGATK